VIAKWRDKVSKKQGEQFAGSRSNPKTLPHTYANKQTAERAAKLAWVKIRERREVMQENKNRA
jgi:phage protein D